MKRSKSLVDFEEAIDGLMTAIGSMAFGYDATDLNNCFVYVSGLLDLAESDLTAIGVLELMRDRLKVAKNYVDENKFEEAEECISEAIKILFERSGANENMRGLYGGSY